MEVDKTRSSKGSDGEGGMMVVYYGANRALALRAKPCFTVLALTRFDHG
jgi:hypothetical protein